jgi:hypothetical protein
MTVRRSSLRPVPAGARPAGVMARSRSTRCWPRPCPARCRTRKGAACRLGCRSAGWALRILVLTARPTPRSLLLALPCLLLGEAVRLWASGHIEKTERLATGGPYAHTRNPLYVGSSRLGWLWPPRALGRCRRGLYFAAFYPSVMREEADFLRRKFRTSTPRGRRPCRPSCRASPPAARGVRTSRGRGFGPTRNGAPRWRYPRSQDCSSRGDC